ncbi:hypothetical protein DMENIID0001_142850 [Sergentomyia squamirostris]
MNLSASLYFYSIVILLSTVVAFYPSSPTDIVEESEVISQRIINGQEAEDGQFPYQVWITAYRGFIFRQRILRCGGSIISEHWVLTAGHCIRHSNSFLNRTSYYVEAGTLVIETLGVEPRQADLIYEEDAHIHPEYNASNLLNDIALLRYHGFDFSTKFVQPIELAPKAWADSEKVFLGKTFILSGYGHALDNRRLPNHLRWTELDFVPFEECRGFYYYWDLASTAFCAGDVLLPIHSGCNGDSGGPIVLEKTPGKFVQVGVVSVGPHTLNDTYCSSSPAGFTSVALFRDWIDSTMAEYSN